MDIKLGPKPNQAYVILEDQYEIGRFRNALPLRYRLFGAPISFDGGESQAHLLSHAQIATIAGRLEAIAEHHPVLPEGQMYDVMANRLTAFVVSQTAQLNVE